MLCAMCTHVYTYIYIYTQYICFLTFLTDSKIRDELQSLTRTKEIWKRGKGGACASSFGMCHRKPLPRYDHPPLEVSGMQNQKK